MDRYSAGSVFKVITLLIVLLLSHSVQARRLKTDSLLRILPTLEEDTNKVRALTSLANAFSRTSDYDLAIRYAGECISLAERLGFPKGIVWGQMVKANVANFRSQYKLAHRILDSALKVANTIADPAFRAGVHNTIGNVYYEQHEISKALDAYEHSAVEWKKTDDSNELAGAYVNLGNMYSAYGNDEQALKLYYQAAAVFDHTGYLQGIEETNYNIGQVYFDSRQFDKALTHFHRSIEIDRQTGNRKSMAETICSVAAVYKSRGDYDAALFYFRQADTIFSSLGALDDHAHTILNIGAIHLNQKKYEEAAHYFNNALKIVEKADMEVTRASVYTALAALFYETNKLSTAENYAKKGLAIATKLGMIGPSRDLYLQLSRIDSLQNDYQSAYFNYQGFIYWRDSFTNQEKERKVTQLALQYEYSKREDSIRHQQQLTRELLQRQTLIAGQQTKVKNFLIAVVGLLVVLFFLAYKNYRTKQQLKLQALRNKIASDLHDDVGSTLSSISMFSQVAQAQSKEVIPALETIGESSRRMLDAMADIVWTINPENDQFEKIIMRMRSFAYQLLGAQNIEFDFQLDDSVSKLNINMECRRNLYLIFKEATNNMVKYAAATKAYFAVRNEQDRLTMTIHDNGKGFDTSIESQGNGLKNMKRRAKEIDAILIIDSQPGNGTIIKLELAV